MEKIEIIKKVGDLYKRYGIKSVTMDDAARHLGISKKTLYQHFTDKNELVKAAVVAELQSRQKNFAIGNTEELNAIEELIIYYKIQVKMILDYKPNFVYDLKKYYPNIYNNYVVLKRERILSSVEQNLKKGIKEGFFRPDLNVNIISRITLMRIEGMIHSGLFTADEMMSPQVFTEIFYYHVYGIVTQKGKEFFEKYNQQFTF